MASALPSSDFCNKSSIGLVNTFASIFSSSLERGLSALGGPETEPREADRAPGADLKFVFSKMIVFTGGVAPSRRLLSVICADLARTFNNTTMQLKSYYNETITLPFHRRG